MINNDKIKAMKTEQYYSLEEVANELKVAYLTVYRWVQAGKLMAHQIEKQYRVSKADLDAFVDARKSTTTPKLQELSKDELINMVRQLKRRKKFGLIWEDSPEKVAEQCKSELPVLVQDEGKAITKSGNGPTNLIIEGDNYHSLSVLNYTHAGKIDVIYIDPPYNTGAKDWKYNNDYVDSNDTFRHSKWLSFMSKRLDLSKKLLSKDGVIITAIDDHELATLILLLKEIFPGYNHEVIIVNHHPQGSGGDNISITHEYAVVSTPAGRHLVVGEPNENEFEEWSLLKAGAGTDYQRAGRPRMFFGIKVEEKTGKVVGIGPELGPDEAYSMKSGEEGIRIVFPIDSQGRERRWRYGREKMLQLIEAGSIKASLPNYSMKVVVPRIGTYRPVYSNWTDSKYNAGPHGTRLLEKIFGDNRFPFPKSIYTVLDIIRSVTRFNREAIILDYFAGSGTTGHATLLLNREDNGFRKFILCTNNENGIAEEVCYPRVKVAIEGTDKLPELTGVSANLRYFKTTFVSKSKVTDDTRKQLVQKSTEMICVRENTFDKVIDKKNYKIYRDSEHCTGVLFNLDAIAEFKKKLQEQELSANIYVFSLTNDTYDEDFADLGLEHRLCPIPESILEVYRKLFRSKK